MSSYCEVYRVCCYSNNKPSTTGNAFVFNGRLITVRHVVEKAYGSKAEKAGKTVQLKPNEGEGLVECEIFEHDEDSFDTSTLVVLRPKTDLKMKQVNEEERTGNSGEEVHKKSLQGYPKWTESQAEDITISDIKRIPNTSVEGEAKLRHPKTKERYNRQIDLQTKKTNYKGLSGSPIYNARGELCGIFNAQKAEDSKAIHGFGLCDSLFHEKRKKLLEKANRKEQDEAVKKTEKNIPSFAEYVADACHDCPPKFLFLLRDPSEYVNRYPGKDISACQSKLQDIVESLLWVDALNEASDAAIDAEIKEVYKKLEDLYSEPTRRLNVYISALNVCVNKAHKERKSNPQGMENIIRLLDHAHTVAGLVDFPYRHLFLAECYIGINKKAEAMKELNIAIKKAGRNTNLLADIYSQIVCCVKGIENSNVLAKLENAKGARPEKSQCCSTYTECLRLLSYYKAENAKAENAEFVGAELVNAVQNIVEAYDLDSSEKGMEEYREEDHKCFQYICNMALNYYTNMGFEGYGDWQAFYRFASGSDMYNKIADTFKGTVWNKWIAAMGQCRYIQTQLEEVVKEQEIEELEYRSVDESGTNIKNVITGLEYCANKQLIVIEWDIAAGYYDALQEEVEKFRALLRNELSSASEREYPVEKEDAHLYKYECKIDDYGENRPPVWVLICRK